MFISLIKRSKEALERKKVVFRLDLEVNLVGTEMRGRLRLSTATWYAGGRV